MSALDLVLIVHVRWIIVDVVPALDRGTIGNQRVRYVVGYLENLTMDRPRNVVAIKIKHTQQNLLNVRLRDRKQRLGIRHTSPHRERLALEDRFNRALSAHITTCGPSPYRYPIGPLP